MGRKQKLQQACLAESGRMEGGAIRRELEECPLRQRMKGRNIPASPFFLPFCYFLLMSPISENDLNLAREFGKYIFPWIETKAEKDGGMNGSERKTDKWMVQSNLFTAQLYSHALCLFTCRAMITLCSGWQIANTLCTNSDISGLSPKWGHTSIKPFTHHEHLHSLGSSIQVWMSSPDYKFKYHQHPS